MLELFDDVDVEDLLEEFGVNCLYYKAKKCTCIIENEGRWDPKDDCYFGWRFEDPIAQRLVRTNFKMDISNINLGEIFHGGCKYTIFKRLPSGTPNPIWRFLSQGDVIVNLNDIGRKTDNLKRGYRDYLYSFNVVKVLSVYYRGKNFVEGKDYQVVYSATQKENTEIKWLDDGDKPESDYTAEFEYNVNYWLFNEQPTQRGAGEDSLPKTVTCVIRPYGETESKGLLNILNYVERPDENINV